MNEQQPIREPAAVGARLVESQTLSPTLAEAYRRELDALTHRQLTPRQRRGGIVCAAFSVVFWGWTSWKMFRQPHPFDFGSDLLDHFVLLAFVLGLLQAALTVFVAVRGQYDRRMNNGVAMLLSLAILGWGGFMFMQAGLTAADDVTRRQFTLCGVTFLVMAGGTIALAILEDYFNRMQERLLRMELRLAEIAERVNRT